MSEAQEKSLPVGGAIGSSDPFKYYNKDQLVKAYTQMLLIRRFEEKAGQLYGMGLIGGFCHLYIGQEAVVVGIQSAMQPQDTVVTSYRDHGHMLACDMDPRGVMAELTGREGGYSRGKGGSMHMFSREKNFFGGHGIVGAQIPIGAGMAFAHKYKNDQGVSISYMGDGAANQGQVYEAFNMAALWKLPAVFVIEDNQYGMGTSNRRASASTEFWKRGEPWGILGREVNGMNLFAVREAAEWAIDHARSGQGPTLLHVKTYRYRGHSMSDPAKYRTKDEVEKMRSDHDPIEAVRAFLLAQKMVTEEDLKGVEKEVKNRVNDSAEFAQTSPEPHESELYTDILIDN
ncbi:pyruvate dehydrogenase (acetyl-transferring) E1 component subunit alpha [Candidatus Odyssella thessalonicensis]|uniref:pyruvate dehydrogenase (acetyl-transferring) E1 component subunit alpha n=1 Tax=Candidatus Odyssella thessalonicensis TaxID=84647 RepID=UPI000225AF69|nr:pyruvate dehydrogenase (acetyl-transferring) E1 component subunit alpha [Candidatus Odyssella thessalonicensis]